MPSPNSGLGRTAAFVMGMAVMGAGSLTQAATVRDGEAPAIKEKASDIALRPIGRVEPEELRLKLEQNAGGASPVFVLDLRNEADFQKSFVPGAVNIPYRKLSFLVEKFFSKSDEIVVYGYPGSDAVSESAVIFLRQKGYADVRVLRGGIGSWKGYLEKAAPGKKLDGTMPKVQVTRLAPLHEKKGE